jgi:hypothetical protein
MLMSRYIAAIPVIGDTSRAAEQIRSFGLPTAPDRNAIIAKVGAAARRRQSDAPRNTDPPRSPKTFVLLAGRSAVRI